MKKKLKKILVMIMALVMCINTMGMNVIATEVSEVELTDQEVPNVEETVEEVSTEVVETGAWDGVTKENSFEGEGFQVTFSLVEYWDTGFNATIKIDNTGENVIENWCLSYEFSNAISNIWNAEIFDQKETVYTIKNVGWNQDIAVGESVEFGISSNEGFQGFPKDYKLLGENGQTNEEDYTVEYNWDNDWETGFQGTVSITNNTESIIEDWTIEFDFENEITDIWDAEIISHEDNHYVIHNAGYNKDINANGTVTFGIVVNEGDSAKEIYNISLTKYVMEDVTEPEREPEPLEDIGEAYFKEPTEDDVVINEETGIMYIKNQVLVSALPGAPKEAFEEIAEYIGADIVGYIELTNDYQFEFQEDKTAEELDNMIAYLNSFSFVSYVSLNLYEANVEERISNDALYNDEKTQGRLNVTDVWDETVPDGDNWGLEAIRVLSAWDDKDKFYPVKVGVYDHSFARNEDLRYAHVINGNLDEVSIHGTHTAGILAAQHNNQIGISGVVTDADLYVCSTSAIGSSMEQKHVYATLIGNNVKVINVSMGEDMALQFAASRNIEIAQNRIILKADILGEFLNKLILQGYDFVIVTSAGNTEDKEFVRDEEIDIKYRRYNSDIDSKKDIVSGNVDAFYDDELTAITVPSVKNRIVVVGAITHSVSNDRTEYEYAAFSNVGNRVDVCAPGDEILSTVGKTSINKFGYDLYGGTSAASPYVAGIAAMMYQINPSISATDVKKIICDSKYTYVKDTHGRQYGIPDAAYCVNLAEKKVNNDNNIENDDSLPSGELMGTIVNQLGVPVSKVNIVAYRTSVDESNVESYYKVVQSGSDGSFIVRLTSGVYDLNIYLDGYLPFTVKNVVINDNKVNNIGKLILSKWTSGRCQLSGCVLNALDGSFVDDVTVNLRKGWNNCTGNYTKDIAGNDRSARTDSEGRFLFEVPMGMYTVEIIKEGYVTGYYNAIATTYTMSEEQTLVITPILSENEYRIILTWDEKPEDLDSHLTYYVDDEKKMHVSYLNQTGYYDGEALARLNLDDVTGYGPETVTITLDASTLEEGVFKYSVHDYTNRKNINSTDMSMSGAMIRVYKGNKMIETFNITRNREGTVWHVFDIEKDGIIVYNEYYNATSISKID